jgi:hypothetical protein
MTKKKTKKIVQNRWAPCRFILVITGYHVHPLYLERHDPTNIKTELACGFAAEKKTHKKKA